MDLKMELVDVIWEEVLIKVLFLNMILVFIYYMYYYFVGVLQVMNGGDLIIRDKFSFDYLIINFKEEWEKFFDLVWEIVEIFVKEIE